MFFWKNLATLSFYFYFYFFSFSLDSPLSVCCTAACVEFSNTLFLPFFPDSIRSCQWDLIVQIAADPQLIVETSPHFPNSAPQILRIKQWPIDNALQNRSCILLALQS
jgi:hypothetical protein